MIADACGHYGCDDHCINGTMIISDEGWDFLDELYNNPPQAIIDEFEEIKKLYENFDWSKLHEGVPFPIGDEKE